MERLYHGTIRLKEILEVAELRPVSLRVDELFTQRCFENSVIFATKLCS